VLINVSIYLFIYLSKPDVNPPGCATSRLRPAATKICYHGNVPCAIEKLREIIYSHSSTNPENLAKIGPVNFETHVIGLTGIVKIN